jgi:hypothetical protein
MVALCAATLGVPGCRSAPPESAEEILSLFEKRAEQLLNEERRVQFVALLDQARTLVAESKAAEAKALARFLELDRDYDTPRESFVALLGEHRKSERAALVRFAELRVEARKLVTAEEWRQLTRGVGDARSGEEDV